MRSSSIIQMLLVSRYGVCRKAMFFGIVSLLLASWSGSVSACPFFYNLDFDPDPSVTNNRITVSPGETASFEAYINVKP